MAWHMGWEPAKNASGIDWLPLYLGPLLDDPYSCVRYIAFRSLRQLPGFEDFTYDFVATAEERKNAVAQVASRWSSSRSRDLDRHGPTLLVDASGNVDQPLLTRLAMARDDKIVDLRE
jgi:hypothetical protein